MAPETLVQEAKARTRLHTAGTSAHRVDGELKVTGSALYTVDVRLPGMLHVKLVRSPFAHARVKAVRKDEALRVPGVVGVFTFEDLRRYPFELYFGVNIVDQPVLADGEVRHEGEPVAAVVAETPRAAHEAARLVDVDYEELPAVLTIAEAIADGAVLVHPTFGRVRGEARPIPGTNVFHHARFREGDVGAGFALADHIFEYTFEYPSIHHVFLEPFACVATASPEGIEVWTSNQHPYAVRMELAEQFNMPLNRVRVRVPYLGGAYGGKGSCRIEPLAVALSWAVGGRPVRLVLSMSESFHTLRAANAEIRMRTGVKADGTLVAARCDIYYQGGAYAHVQARVTTKGGMSSTGPYRIPHVEINSYAVYTHTVPTGAFRGLGVPHVCWAHEAQMNYIARALGIDPVRLREKNLLRRGETFREGETPIDADFVAGLRAVAEKIGWDTPKGPWRGRAVAVGIKQPKVRALSQAMVRIYADGSVTLVTGATEMGQGAATVLAQIAAEELGASLDQVSVSHSDTDLAAFEVGTSGSGTTTLTGLAVQKAAREARRKLEARLARKFPGEDIAFLGRGRVRWGARECSFKELVAKVMAPGEELVGHGALESGPGVDGRTPFWEVGMAAAEVEVDPETGRIRVVKCVTAADVGRAINPLQVEAQDEGGAMMGLGSALYEELVFVDGQLVNPNLVEYRVPTMEDVPETFRSILIENEDGPGPYGAKGAGESGVYVGGAAIGGAIADALGVELTRLPITPERVREVLRAREKKE